MHVTGYRRTPPAGSGYLAKRVTDGKSKTEAIRCLKRSIAREVFAALPIPAAA